MSRVRAGSWLWGYVASSTSLETAHLAAGVLLMFSLVLHMRFRLPAGETPDLRPRQLPELELAFPFDREVGPVLVLIEYRVPLANTGAFVRAIDEVGHVQPVGDPERALPPYGRRDGVAPDFGGLLGPRQQVLEQLL